ncbi:MAG: hypothetical protein J7K68_03490 [Candidatus Diapherotrites archaeon]|nr:hypothetical protein [Candidatus Diapherotrites archaeon]
MKKGSLNIEFVIAVTLFISAFWVLYLQGSTFITQRIVRNDVRYPAMYMFSEKIMKEAGEPKDWNATNTYTTFGLAYYDGKTYASILDENKLDAMNGSACPTMELFNGIDFAIKVRTKAKVWECTTNIKKITSIQRPVYVRMNSGAYKEGVIYVWAA